jgi:hypothetical protein
LFVGKLASLIFLKSKDFRLLFPPKIQRTSAFQNATVALFLICECKDSGPQQPAQDFSEKSFKFGDFCRFLAAKPFVLFCPLYKVAISR